MVREVESVVNSMNIGLVQQLVNMVKKTDAPETYRRKALAELEKHEASLTNAEQQVLLKVVDWIAQNIDLVKAKKLGERRNPRVS